MIGLTLVLFIVIAKTYPFNASVIVLPSQQLLYAQFTKTWSSAWPDMTPNAAVGIEKHIRGHGVCLSLLNVLQNDLAANTTVPSAIFEPDALPFPNVNYSSISMHEFVVHDVYFLGGHNVFTNQQPTTKWVGVLQIYGCYGMIISSHARRRVWKHLKSYCAEARMHYDIDVVLSRCFDSVVATPLLIDHPKMAFSETWRTTKVRNWASVPTWWNFRPLPPLYDKNKVCVY